MRRRGSGGLSIFLTVYIQYIQLRKSKIPRMFTVVNICAVYYLSNTCQTPVKQLFSIYLHRVTGNFDKMRCKRMCLRLPVTLSH